MALTTEQQTVLEAIQVYMCSDTSILDATFYEDVIKRLDSFGYTLQTTDAWVLSFIMQKVENKIKNACNILVIPDGLLEIAVDMVCGEFLFNMQQSGGLPDTFNSDEAIKQVKLGDTSVELGGSGNTKSLDLLIRYLMGKEGDLLRYRKMNW